MDTSSFPNQKHKKKRLSQDQVTILERSFTSDQKLEPHRKLQLANQLGVPPRQIAIWYQNKRARWKTQALELDRGTLESKLEEVMEEKRQLEGEVERLKRELKKAQETLICIKDGDHPDVSNCSGSAASCVEGASYGNVHHEEGSSFWENDEQNLRFEELYACLMDTNGSSVDRVIL